MELMDSSMDRIIDRVYHQLHSTIPEEILGKLTVAVSLHESQKMLWLLFRDNFNKLSWTM